MENRFEHYRTILAHLCAFLARYGVSHWPEVLDQWILEVDTLEQPNVGSSVTRCCSAHSARAKEISSGPLSSLSLSG